MPAVPDRQSAAGPRRNDAPRPAPVDREPSSRVGLVLILLDEVTRTADRLRPVLQAIERVTGLSPGQMQTLLTIGQPPPGGAPGGAGGVATDHPSDRSTGLTITDLMARGLLETEPPAPTHGAPPRGGLRLTDSGLAALSQVQGVQIRVLDTVVSALGDQRVGALRDSLHTIGAVLDDLAAHTGERA